MPLYDYAWSRFYSDKILKYRYLNSQQVIDTDTLIKTIKAAIESFNNMPNSQLYGLTPNEVLKGLKPNKDMFKNQLRVGKQERILTNQMFDCKMACKT